MLGLLTIVVLSLIIIFIGAVFGLKGIGLLAIAITVAYAILKIRNS